MLATGKIKKLPMSSTEVNWIHILLIAPAIGYASWLNYQGQPLPPSMALVGMIVALIVVLFHAFRLWQKRTPTTAVNVDVQEFPNGNGNGNGNNGNNGNGNNGTGNNGSGNANQVVPAPQGATRSAY